MATREKPPVGQIVPASSQALAVRSSALVLRGLRDLARESNWLIKKVFTGRSPRLVISPTGQVGAVAPPARKGVQRVVLYDIERSVPTMALSVPHERPMQATNLPAAFAWSPTARHLVAAWGAWPSELHLFDLHGKILLGTFGGFRNFPECLAWSDTGKYFSAASSGGKGASLRLWKAEEGGEPLAGAPAIEIGVPDWIEPQNFGEEFREEGGFEGYGRTAFSPDERRIASVVQIQGEWADDSILIADTPSLRKEIAIEVQGHVTDLSWTPDNQGILFCAAGQAFRLDARTGEFSPLPFGAELCACHPDLPVAVCFSSWLKNSAKGRLFITDLRKQTIFDEYAAEGVANLRWSLDGEKAYAVTEDGLAYLYEPPLI